MRFFVFVWGHAKQIIGTHPKRLGKFNYPGAIVPEPSGPAQPQNGVVVATEMDWDTFYGPGPGCPRNPNSTFEEVVEEGRRMRETPPEPPTPALPAALTLSGAVMTEAPYSVNVKVSQGGYTFQLTIRKQEHSALLDAMTGLPAWLEAHGYQPAEAPRQAEPETAAAEDTPEAPSCRYHQAMPRMTVARSASSMSSTTAKAPITTCTPRKRRWCVASFGCMSKRGTRGMPLPHY